MTVIGALLCASGDLDFNLLGYLMAGISCILQALYLVLCSKASALHYNSHSIMYHASCLSCPVLLIWSTFEYPSVIQFSFIAEPAFILCLLSVCLMGSLLNFALFLCTVANSPLTTAIVGQLKGIVTTSLGFVLFGSVNLSATGFLGVGVNTCGGLLYALVKYVEAKAQHVSLEAPEKPVSV